MTATDELRRLLDERGVEWTYGDGTVSYASDGRWFHAWAYSDDTMCVSMGYLTPAQAVEATLGRGTCRMEPFIYEDTGAFIECSECGWQLFDADYSIDAAREWLGYCPNCGAKVVDA